MDIMKPKASSEIPAGDMWLYEVKYDGFRCVLEWEKDVIRLKSRNDKDLTDNFPEIVDSCLENQSLVHSLLPIKLDGELVILNNSYQANFSLIQQRGRLKSKDSIKKAAASRPASFLAFDLIEQSAISLKNEGFSKRKDLLEKLLNKLSQANRLQFVPSYKNPNELWKIIFDYKAEGMIAKRKKSNYSAGKKHHDWFKIKNWRTIFGFLTHYDTKNGYFIVQVYENDSIKEIGKCKHGLDAESVETLKKLFAAKGKKEAGGYRLPPAICAAIHTLDMYKNEPREPEFASLLPDASPSDFTIQKLNLDMALLPPNVELTNTAKVFWPDKHLTKGDLLFYIREISPYMLPFLKKRALTLIRCPDGVTEEHFFQKHLPDYAPAFINNIRTDDGKLIICNDLESLVWFANHGAVEFHIPFQTAGSSHPEEIVFDLDPPDRDRFSLAIQAALLIKPLLDDLGLVSFAKTSGNKGLQIHIPIPKSSMTYDETATFTQAIAWTVENAYPDLFTTERLKKNRNERLYIDYVQHGKDKTLIAPYSPRKTDEGTVATPLFWEEVVEGLRPEQFTIKNVLERVQKLGCPFRGYFDAGKKQQLDKVLKLVKM
ncbi:DNA ligase D [Virgibacillus profundi]|uniref:DNA ligase (ATP) n=1 Tax=Virgibacillus profundi TaxID=2024555 RepID=A0A2A2IJ62_9BACI|nr:DNA ligase D [Virgibacillus profundi]PAV31428.1 DNA ligase D [Virgibacillus profundi]PXY55614.1 DNA ligase D [Virgibacillus profundi]